MTSDVSTHPDETVIEPGGGVSRYWRELWSYRELFLFLSWRDILVRYKQTLLGVSWCVVRPLITMVVFTVIFHKLAKLPSGNVPYPVMVYTALLPWQLFAASFQEGSNSLVAAAGMISKVYFPRIIIPATAIMSGMVDFLISLALFFGLMLMYHVMPTARFLFLPLLIALTPTSTFSLTRSMILEGNVSEPDTLVAMLEKLEVVDGTDNHPRTVVIDAGIATEENLSKLRDDPRFEYVAISRKQHAERALFSGAAATPLAMSYDKELVVEIARQEKETFLLCKSPDRERKEKAIHTLRNDRFEKAMRLLNDGLNKPRTVKDSSSIHQRIGRIKERYRIGHFYTIDVKEEDGIAREIRWTYHPEKEFGEYIIRTSRQDLDASQLSTIHRTLTMIEASFKWLKSDLGLRPNFHQQDARMCTHASISVLAYFVLAPILHRIQWGGEFVANSDNKDNHFPWDRPHGRKGIVRTMSSQTRVTTAFTRKNGKRMNVRTTVEPTAEQLEVYKRLKVPPRPLKRTIQEL